MMANRLVIIYLCLHFIQALLKKSGDNINNVNGKNQAAASL